jgi:hypothetical protein
MMKKATPVPKTQMIRGGFPPSPHSITFSSKNPRALITKHATPIAKMRKDVETPQIACDAKVECSLLLLLLGMLYDNKDVVTMDG